MSESTQPTQAPAAAEFDIEGQRQAVEGFLIDLLAAFGRSDATVTVTVSDDEAIEASVDGPELGLLVGQKGVTLQAVQELVRSMVQRRFVGQTHARVRLDVAGYRARRKVALERFAREVAESVKASGVAKALDPMGSADRKVVHDAVNEIEGVSTVSGGRGRGSPSGDPPRLSSGGRHPSDRGPGAEPGPWLPRARLQCACMWTTPPGSRQESSLHRCSSWTWGAAAVCLDWCWPGGGRRVGRCSWMPVNDDAASFGRRCATSTSPSVWSLSGRGRRRPVTVTTCVGCSTSWWRGLRTTGGDGRVRGAIPPCGRNAGGQRTAGGRRLRGSPRAVQPGGRLGRGPTRPGGGSVVD